MSRVQSTLADGSKAWEQRVSAVSIAVTLFSLCHGDECVQLKEVRGVVAAERVDRQQLLSHLKAMQEAFLISVRHTHATKIPSSPSPSLSPYS